MDIASLVVAIVALVVSIFSTAYARRSARSGDKAAIAAGETAALDGQRRHEELTPHFKISCIAAGVEQRKLEIKLIGPPSLGRLDGLTVTIRDDNPWLAEATSLASGPSAEEVRKQIWGPYRFTPGTGPGADPVRGIPGADRDGHSTPTGGMPVGETLPFFLEPVTRPHCASPTTHHPRGLAARPWHGAAPRAGLHQERLRALEPGRGSRNQHRLHSRDLSGRHRAHQPAPTARKRTRTAAALMSVSIHE